MAELTPGSSAWLDDQIAKYRQEVKTYELYEQVLRRVLTAACAHALPEALVQARTKGLSSFVEKCVRKHRDKPEKYPDPANQFTDLCGARVVVQTPQQVRAVRDFIEGNFCIVEADDKVMKLDQDRFGYRDMHYVIRLRADRDLGITPRERKRIGHRIAEIQVRTWVQHAWADTLHDRLYKAKLRPSPELLRAGALLAATMERGDREFESLAEHIDDMAANYTAFATRAEVQREIETQRTILQAEPDAGRKPALALRLSQLLARATGDYAGVVTLLKNYAGVSGPLRSELLMELGYALCRVHPVGSPQYRRGQAFMEESANIQADKNVTEAPDLRRARSLLARTLARLAWSREHDGSEECTTLELYQQALALEPENPYYLADALDYEICCARDRNLPASAQIAVRRALAMCRAHATAGIEMPGACFAAGRLNLLLSGARTDEPQLAHAALGWYARGLRHCGMPNTCVPEGLLEDELSRLNNLRFGKSVPQEIGWVRGLLELARGAWSRRKNRKALAELTSPAPPRYRGQVMIVVGGAASLAPARAVTVEARLAGALMSFRGTVISGGTTSGVPGCVGAAAAVAAHQGLRVVGYIPRRLPHDAKKDLRYGELVVGRNAEFSPAQVLATWADLLLSGIRPADVRVLGFGGGPLSALEYRVALALGATVAIVTETPEPGACLTPDGGSADAGAQILADPLWAADPRLLPLPDDPATLRALLAPPDGRVELTQEQVEQMAQEFHRRFVEDSSSRFPENLRPWRLLDAGYRRANHEQARQAVGILEEAEYEVRRQKGGKGVIREFREDDERLHLMAELEHGRWNVERLLEGWRPGPVRDNERKINPMIRPWTAVDSAIRRYDYNAVRAYPDILKLAGLEIVDERAATQPDRRRARKRAVAAPRRRPPARRPRR